MLGVFEVGVWDRPSILEDVACCSESVLLVLRGKASLETRLGSTRSYDVSQDSTHGSEEVIRRRKIRTHGHGEMVKMKWWMATSNMEVEDGAIGWESRY